MIAGHAGPTSLELGPAGLVLTKNIHLRQMGAVGALGRRKQELKQKPGENEQLGLVVQHLRQRLVFGRNSSVYT